MKRSQKLATGLALSLTLGLLSAVQAHPGERGAGTGPGSHGAMQHGAGHGMERGMQHGAMRGGAEGCIQAQDGSAEERAAFREKMRNATPEERQQLAEARRAEMHRGMEQRGGMQHEHRGMRGRAGQQAPATGERTN